jgi:hypothetical protein
MLLRLLIAARMPSGWPIGMEFVWSVAGHVNISAATAAIVVERLLMTFLRTHVWSGYVAVNQG